MSKNKYNIPTTELMYFNTRDLMRASSASEEIVNPAPVVRPAANSNAPVTF